MGDVRADTYTALAKAVTVLAGELDISVAMPNVKFEPPSRAGKRLAYLVFSFLPNTSELDGLAFDGGVTDEGMMQISVFWPANEGLVKPLNVAGQIAAAFPPGLWLPEATTDVRFDRVPSVAPPMQESDLVHVPVTMRWRAHPH